MSGLPDSSWLNAFKLPTQVMVGLFIACSILLFIDSKEVITLNQFGNLSKSIIIAITVVSGSLSFTGIFSFFKDQFTNSQKRSILSQRRSIRTKENESNKEKNQKKVIQRLDYLSCDETRHLVKCLEGNTQSFFTYVHSSSVGTLISKGLVYGTGGTHNQDQYPFTIHDEVWQELVSRKEEFLLKHQECVKEKEAKDKNKRFRR
ncbi:MAG: superinfection exclusion B family protein [Thiomicrorhabdus sp.]|nr:superinfection exclusion B family protein [Thiomicrorhabdus sp.]